MRRVMITDGVLTLLFWLVSGAIAVATSMPAAPPGEKSHGAPTRFQYPPLSVIQGTLITSAEKAFNSDEGAFFSSVDWHRRTKLNADDRIHHPAAYLACTPPDFPDSLAVLRHLQALSSSESTVRVVSSSEEYGICFFVTATPEKAEYIRSSCPLFSNGGSGTWMPYPSTLKLAPGLLDHEGTFAWDSNGGNDRSGDHNGDRRRTGKGKAGDSFPSVRLTTTYGKSLKFPRDDGRFSSPINGLTIQLAPGVLPATNRRRRETEQDTAGVTAWFENGEQILEEWLEELMADSLNIYETNFWSSESGAIATSNGLEDGITSSREDALLPREWIRAAEVLHELGGGVGAEEGPTVGSACSWHNIYVFHTDDDLLTLRGIDHLLPGGRGVGGTEGEEADELQMACFMALLSYLAARPEVLHVAPERKFKTHNAAAIANVQSADLTRTPLTDSGLDGSGEVIQVVDTGLDYNSCFFRDEDGVEVAHGHYFEELGIEADALSQWYFSSYNPKIAQIFTGGNYTFDHSRRKIVQYIDLIKQNHENASNPQPYGESWKTTFGQAYKWISPVEFSEDAAAGHGTHTAGSAAGSTITNPATTEDCEAGRELSCVGGCIDPDDDDGDDLVPEDTFYWYYSGAADEDLDRLCPRYDCDGFEDDSVYCLDDDEAKTLADHGGVARGAKLAIFDVLDDYTGIGVVMAGRGVWDPSIEAGAKIHSNSWGSSSFCVYDFLDVIADDFMYVNPENLLIISAGNDGEYSYYYGCTVGGPGIAKNVLTIGASTSGPGRLSATGASGEASYGGTDRAQDIDMMAYFSSTGPALDGRIKPDVVAPGDMVYSAAGGVNNSETCRLWDYSGTSMSAPIVAGSAALVRQYFTNETFYAHDVETRGYCDSFGCEAFSPSAATLKAMLINSANLMGGSAEPDGIRGFGRVHLEPGMPLKGEGNRALFVADSADTSTPEMTLTEYSFQVNGSAALELRATLAWIDPPTSALAAKQLVHDLDLAVYSPDGTRFSMWKSGQVDNVNNVERVIVPAETVADFDGTWGVRVWSKRLAAKETQAYALVVTGAIAPPEENDGTVARVRETSTMTSSTDT